MERETKQLRTILEVLKESGRPLTPEEIVQLGRKKLPRLGVTTVYRKIRELADEGLLLGVNYPGQPTRFELPTEREHPHFVCYECRKVFDLEIPLEEVPLKLPEGFESRFQELVVHGLCPECSQSKKAASKD